MTLIAQTIHKKVPFIVGDIVVSSAEGNPSIPYPTATGDISHLVGDLSDKPDEYWQKVYVIKPNLAIGLAGDMYEMKLFLEELKLQCSYYDELSFDNLIEVLDRYDKENYFKKSAFIACMITKDGDYLNVQTLNYPKNGAIRDSSNFFEKITAIGTGSDDFIASAKEAGRFMAHGEEDSLQRAISANLVNLIILFAKEVTTLHNLQSFWGGGFETIFYNGSCWQKLNDVAFVVFMGETDAITGNVAPFPRMVFYLRYYQDVLFYSCIRIDTTNMKVVDEHLVFTSKGGMNNTFAVPAIDYKEKLIPSPPSLSFSTNRVGVGFSLKRTPEVIQYPSAYLEGSVVEVSHVEKTSTTIRIHTSFFTMMNEQFRQND